MKPETQYGLGDVIFVDLRTGERIDMGEAVLAPIHYESESYKKYKTERLTAKDKKILQLIGIYKKTKKKRIQNKLYKRISTMLSEIGY